MARRSPPAPREKPDPLADEAAVLAQRDLLESARDELPLPLPLASRSLTGRDPGGVADAVGRLAGREMSHDGSSGDVDDRDLALPAHRLQRIPAVGRDRDALPS